MTRRTRMWMTILACAGLLAAAASTYVHVRMLGDPTYASFCDINASVSCTQVYQSRYGSVLGVPVALGGVIWFAAVLLLTYAGARAPRAAAPNVAGYLLLWSTVGLAVAMYMAYASFFVLGTICLLCVVVYVAVVGIFILSGGEEATPARRLPAAVLSDLRALAREPVGMALLVVFLVGSFGSAGWFTWPRPAPAPAVAAESAAPPPAPVTGDLRSEFERYWEAEPRVDLALPASADTAGVAVVVVKFNDYQCPACANAHRAYAPIFAKYASSHPGRVRQVTLDYPLDPACNEQAPRGQHHGACAGAVAVRLAAGLGEDVRVEMEEWLYANQPGLDREAVVEALADVAGIDRARYDAAYDETVLAVQGDIALGNGLPVEATPTYVINGVVIKGTLAPRYFDAAIAYELEHAGGERGDEEPAP
ncbi:MAG: thioredoxin domain-containing protein [Acidobacteria bacterium]|nr:thioredoxin domain-containing protein [Acidobacteriota bacterium]